MKLLYSGSIVVTSASTELEGNVLKEEMQLVYVHGAATSPLASNYVWFITSYHESFPDTKLTPDRLHLHGYNEATLCYTRLVRVP